VSGGVLAVFAHPDDESIFAGGTLAACAAAGLDVGVLSLTRGELGGQGREQELRAAAGELGIAWAECLDHRDGELAYVRSVVEDVAERLRRSEPEAVLTFGEEGLYWHPDHIAAHLIVRGAMEMEALEPPARLYTVVWPLGLTRGLVTAMAKRGRGTDLWGLDPDGFGVDPDAIALRLDVGRFLHVKLRAMSRYRSQIGPGHLLHELPADTAREYLGHEYFSGEHPGWLAEVVAGA
jgi:LmbE family N-acetylglucosaminyl deacetylase